MGGPHLRDVPSYAVAAGQTAMDIGGPALSFAKSALSNPLVDVGIAATGIKAFGPSLMEKAGQHFAKGMGMPGAAQAPKPTTMLSKGMDIARQLGPRIGGALAEAPGLVPAAAFSAPYAMAAKEQANIRENPYAGRYATNPYAMQQRGEVPTQGAGGALNTRNAIANQQYGGLTQTEKDALEQDRLDRAIRLKAAKKVLGQ
jgi:hypothetical protein